MHRFLALTFALLAFLVPASVATATQVSYVDGGQVWVSTLDGAQKRSISGPAPVVDASETRQWTAQAQSDDGWIIGLHKVPAKFGATNATVLWDPTGAQAGTGKLTYPSARINAAYPVYLDLTPDGTVVTYTYSDLVYNYPVSNLYTGTWVEGSSGWFVDPFDISGITGSALVGRRLVGLSGKQVVVQKALSGAPYTLGSDFDTWFDLSGDITPWQIDVAANGSAVAFQFRDGGGAEQIGIMPTSGLGAPITAEQDALGCLLPVVGKAEYPSISQDGQTIAWHDDRGVVVAGIPAWFPSTEVSTCALSRPAVVISATGKFPSLGNSTAATPPASTPTTGTPGTAGSTPTTETTKQTTTTSAKPSAAVARTVKASAFSKGLPLTVTLKRAGTVTATAKVGRTVLAKATKKAKRAGKVKLTLKASKQAARKLRGYRGKTLTITVKGPGGTVIVKRKLK